ncbi:MAG: regulatory protein RecX [Francisellaceae bacterium]
MTSNPLIKEKDYLLYLLSRQEYSQFQLRQKLIKRANLAQDDIENLLDEFKEKGWQSDRRFAESFVRSQVASHHGRYYIEQKGIYKKGLDKTLLQQVIDDSDIDWQAQAYACYQKKYGIAELNGHDVKEKQKRLQYLVRHGFDFDLAHKVLAKTDDI